MGRFPRTALDGDDAAQLIENQRAGLSADEKFYRRLLRASVLESARPSETDLNLGSVPQVAARADVTQRACRQAFDRIAGIRVDCYDAGMFLAQRGWFAEAEVALRRAMEINPIDPAIYRELAEVLQRQGKDGQASLAERRAMTVSRASSRATVRARQRSGPNRQGSS
jgi:predicted Zn-dependent protease